MPRQPFVHERVVRARAVRGRPSRREACSRQTAMSPDGTPAAGSRRNPDNSCRSAPRFEAVATAAIVRRNYRRAPFVPMGEASIRLTCCSSTVWLPEASTDCQIEQLLVGHAAPQEEGQARREFEIGQAVRGSRRNVGRIAFDAEEEVRVGEDALDAELQPGVETPILSTLLEETEQDCDLPIGDGSPVRTSSDGRENPARARRLLGRAPRRADQDGATARRIARAFDGVRSVYGQTVD